MMAIALDGFWVTLLPPPLLTVASEPSTLDPILALVSDGIPMVTRDPRSGPSANVAPPLDTLKLVVAGRLP